MKESKRACVTMIPAKLDAMCHRGLAISFNFCILHFGVYYKFFTLIFPTTRGVTPLCVDSKLVETHYVFGMLGLIESGSNSKNQTEPVIKTCAYKCPSVVQVQHDKMVSMGQAVAQSLTACLRRKRDRRS